MHNMGQAFCRHWRYNLCCVDAFQADLNGLVQTVLGLSQAFFLFQNKCLQTKTDKN